MGSIGGEVVIKAFTIAAFIKYNGVTTDGSYSLTIVGTDGSSATSTPFVASSNTAAQICAGVVAGCLSNPTFAGLITGAVVATTDNVVVSFAARGVVYTVTATSPSTGPTQSNTTTAGYTEIAVGIIFGGEGSPWESGSHWRTMTHWDEKAETAEQFAADLATLRALPSDEWTPAEASKIATVIREVLARREPSP